MTGLTSHTRLPLWLLFIGAVGQVAYYFPCFSGDGLIHFVFARHLLEGGILQFNLGDFSGGETSPLFMAVVAALIAALGPVAALCAVKAGGVLGLGLISWLVFVIRLDLGASRRAAAVSALTLLVLPGSALNGQIGTENVYFAIVTLVWFRAVLRRGLLSFEPRDLGPMWVEVLLMASLGVAFFLRPEAALVAATFFAWRCLHFARKPQMRTWGLVARTAVGWCCFGLPVAGGLILLDSLTGSTPLSSGLARRTLSISQDAVMLGGLALNTKAAMRILAMSGLLGLGCVGVLRRNAILPVRFLGLLIGFVFGVHLFTLVPSTHFARYTIYVWPLVMLCAAEGCSHLLRMARSADSAKYRSRPLKAVWVAVGLIITVIGLESHQRWHMGRRGFEAAVYAVSPGVQAAMSRRFRRFLGRPDGPVTVAMREVQARLWLDPGFTVRSLDGIVDDKLQAYVCDGYYDHDGYLIDRKVDFVMDLANYNRDPRRWALSRLERLRPGESLERPGIRYTMLAGKTVSVQRRVSHSTQRSAQPCRAKR